MNTFILVPPQRLINEVIKAINKIIQGINAPFKALHELAIGASLGKIFGKNIGFEIRPFGFIPKELVPSCPYLPYKCIEEPEGYKSVWGYSTPKECKTKSTKKKKKTVKEERSGLLSNFIVCLILMLFGLFYIGNHEGIMNNIKSSLNQAPVPAPVLAPAPVPVPVLAPVPVPVPVLAPVVPLKIEMK